MNASVIRLSSEFLINVKGFGTDSKGKVKASARYKNVMMNNISELLAGGHTEEELRGYMQLWRGKDENPEDIYKMDDIIRYAGMKVKKSKVIHDPENIIKPGHFYYHPVLQITPGAPKLRILDDGTFEADYDTEPFYLEIVNAFTYRDIATYFHKTMGRSAEDVEDRDVGAFKHILKTMDLDHAMYTIDISRFMSEDIQRPLPKRPFEIKDFEDEGQALLDDRKNNSYMEGLNRVIPRKN